MNALPYTLANEAEAIYLFSNSYKKEQFMKSRKEYVRLALERYHEFDPIFVEYLMDAATEPEMHLLETKELREQLRQMIKRDYAEDLLERCGIITSRIMPGPAFASVPHDFKTLFAQDVENDFKFLEEDLKSLEAHLVRNQSTDRVIKTFSNGSRYLKIHKLSITMREECGCNFRCPNSCPHSNSVMGCGNYKYVLTEALRLDDYADMAIHCAKSWGRYESNWHRMLIHQQSKPLISNTDTVVAQMTKRMTSLEKQNQVLTKKVSDREDAMVLTTARLNAMERLNQSLVAKVNEAREELNSLKNSVVSPDRIDDLEDRVSEMYIDEHVEAIREEIDNLTNRVESTEVAIRDMRLEEKPAVDHDVNARLLKLEKMLSPQNEFIRRIEIVPVYDYVLIKNRSRVLHGEFHRTYRFFARLLQMKYCIPYAIAVPSIEKP